MSVILIVSIYLLVTLLLFKLKPSSLFHEDGTVKQFGVDSLFSLHVVLILLVVLLTFVVNVISID